MPPIQAMHAAYDECMHITCTRVHIIMKVFDHTPVAEYNRRSKKQVCMVKDRLNTCACMHTQSVVGKGSLQIYTWTIYRPYSEAVARQ